MPLELTTVSMGSAEIERYRPALGDGLWPDFLGGMRSLAAAVQGRVVWNVNSTAQGGGVAEMLGALIPYERGAGVDARWVVIEGPPAFFKVTKRIHALLHGVPSDGSEIIDGERRVYEETLADNARALLQQIRPQDVVILHDPQTAGLAPALSAHGCRLVWRCHVGVDQPNAASRLAWDFLRPYVSAADAVVFSRRAYAWEGLDDARIEIIPPCIDAFAPKNQELDASMVAGILRAGGLVDQGDDGRSASFLRADGSAGEVTRSALVLEESKVPADAHLVLQVSRWDRLKDPIGVMEGFARYIAPETAAHLVLAGPAPSAVADDPEEEGLLKELMERWRGLEESVRRRVHLAQLPMDDEEENAAMVNALQRRAQVVVQKSLAEGFGLTVAEAMWKSRPVVATRVGGIVDQVEDLKSGRLVDPGDLAAFGRAVVECLGDPQAAGRLGREARRRVTRGFLVPRHLLQQGRLVEHLLG